MFLNADTPLHHCLIRNEFLYNQERGHGEYTPCLIIATNSVEGRAVSFSCVLENGAVWARRPIHAFCARPCEPLPLSTLALWDCFSYDVAVNQYRYLKPLSCEVLTRDGLRRPGRYLFTLDWCGIGTNAEVPDQAKCAHIIELESGHLAAMPNNRIVWHEPSWIKPLQERPDWLVDGHCYQAEGGYPIKDGDKYAYRLGDEP